MWCGRQISPAIHRNETSRRQASFTLLLNILLNSVSNSLGIGNALAFDAEGLSPVLALDLLTNVTKSVVIHGFGFTEALEHTLKQCLTLGKHTSIVHFKPHCVMQYVWAHKDYQPWGHTLPLQCPQCGILNPWTLVYMAGGYDVKCKNEACRDMSSGIHGGRYSFRVDRPEDSVLVQAGKDSGWLRVAM